MASLSALRDEIRRKRALAHGAVAGNPENAGDGRAKKRWRSAAELEAQREREYREEQKARDAEARRRRERKLREAEALVAVRVEPEKGPEVVAASRVGEPPLERAEVVRRLRVLGEPATFFGEDPWDRFDRLRNVELARDDNSQGQRNVFQKKLRELKAKDAVDDVYRYTGAEMPQLDAQAKKAQKKRAVANEGDGDDVSAAPSCKEDYVFKEIRKFMGLWQSEIDSMPSDERRTNKGRSLFVTYEQTKDWLKPLNKLLRRRKLDRKVLDALKNIFEAVEEREYVRANGVYLEHLAIGNAPWPMGATMVGIHARAAREKIGEDKIAHVMNDEQTRKYIQAIKRLMTVSQRHFPTVPSKMIS